MVSQGALIRYPPVQHRHGLVSSTLGLRFTLSSRHFLGGSMRVKCVASVSPVLWRGDRESVVQSLPIKDMREALLLGEWTLLSHGWYYHQLISFHLFLVTLVSGFEKRFVVTEYCFVFVLLIHYSLN